jgi:hypothetical protein
MTLEPCAVCHGPGAVGNPELRMTLCYSCDVWFAQWREHTSWAPATDWPGLVGGAA